MGISPARLDMLFNLYYEEKATSQEIEELFTLIRDAKNDEHLAQLLKEAWEKLQVEERPFSTEISDKILNSILGEVFHENDQAEEKVRSLHWIRYVAAAAIFLVAIGFYRIYHKPDSKSLIVSAPKKEADIAPGGNRALLTLSDGSTIILDSAHNGLLAQQGFTEVNKTEDGRLVYHSKAADSVSLTPPMNMLSTPKGGQYQIVLPDGSKAWLNASSSIRFPAAFTKNERIVEITGEVYFEVAKDKTKPFRVLFKDSEVEVLGTTFNIMAYQDELASKTTLVEGLVKLKNQKGNKQLKPGEQGSVQENGQIVLAMVDVDIAIAWKSGLFYFRDAGIEEIMRQTSRWYDIEIKYNGNIPVRQFTGKVSRNVNISELLSMLRYAGVNCWIEDNKVVVSS